MASNITLAALNLLAAVERGEVGMRLALGSVSRWESRRRDTRQKCDAAVKRLRDAGLIRPTGGTLRWAPFELTDAGRAALAARRAQTSKEES